MRAFGCLFVGSLFLAACGARSEKASTDEAAVTGGATTLSPIASTEPATGPSYSFQYNPVIANGNGTLLAAWLDREAATPTSRTARVRAARLDSSGDLLDARGIALPSVAPGEDSEPALAFDGTSFLVVWTHSAPPATVGGSSPESFVLAARIGLDGALLDAQPVELGRTAGKLAGKPSVAWNGAEYLVAWLDYREAKPQVYAARLSPALAPIGSALGFKLSLAGGDGGSPSVAAAGATFLVAWDELDGRNRIRATRVTGDTVVDATAFTITSGGQPSGPSIASDGTDFFVAWYNYSSSGGGSGTSTVSAQRISNAGAAIGTSLSVAATRAGRPAVMWDGTGYAVAYEGGAKRFAGDGTALPTTFAGESSSEESRPAIGWNGTSYVVLRTQRTSAALAGQVRNVVTGAVYASTGGAPLRDGISIARADAPQRQPVSAFDGTNHLVVWQEFRTDWEHPEIWGAFVKPDGAFVDPKGFQLRSSKTLPSKPVVAFDGTGYVVAWEERGGDLLKVAATRVSTTGTAAGEPIVINGTRPSLAGGGGKAVLLANDRAYFVPASGPIDDAHPAFVRGEETGWTMGTVAPIVFDGTRFILAWSTYKAGTSTTEIHALRFSATGQKLDARPIIVARQDVNPSSPAMSVATDGNGQTLVAWENRSINTGTIMGARIDASGVASTPIRLDNTAAPNLAFAPAVTFDGVNWLLAYETRQDFNRTEGGSPLSMARLRFLPNGLDRVGEVLPLTAGAGWSASLGPSAQGKALITFESMPSSIGGAAFASPGRAAVRLFGDAAGPAVTPPPGPGTSSGTTAPGDDDDDTGEPASSSGGDATQGPRKPSNSFVPTKGATVKPKGGDTGVTPEEGGCSTAPRSSSGGAFLLVAVAALLVRRRRLA